ncbi:MAG: diguanylate cyclase [Gammaproteobacteria bacterium]
MTAKPDLSIIVADDVELTRAIIKSALTKAGYQDVRLAEDADQVLVQINERRADIILADWVMPEMDGLELTNCVRQHDEDANHYTSIILITSKDGMDHLVEAFDHGVDDYLQKPINERELAARVYAAGRSATLQNTLLETTQALEYSNRQLQELATTDPLTGLGNRRHIVQNLTAVLHDTEARGGMVACLSLDLDNFKDINDNFGHQVGDEVLVGLARRLRRAIRPTDTIGRMGGEEFCIVMYFMDPAHCKPGIFDRILTSISKRPFQTSAGEMAITASIGVSYFDSKEHNDPLEGVLKKADDKLYQAKASGRNIVIS